MKVTFYAEGNHGHRPTRKNYEPPHPSRKATGDKATNSLGQVTRKQGPERSFLGRPGEAAPLLPLHTGPEDAPSTLLLSAHSSRQPHRAPRLGTEPSPKLHPAPLTSRDDVKACCDARRRAAAPRRNEPAGRPTPPLLRFTSPPLLALAPARGSGTPARAADTTGSPLTTAGPRRLPGQQNAGRKGCWGMGEQTRLLRMRSWQP